MPAPLDRKQRNREHDAKRRTEQPWRKWYKLPAWQAARRAQLQAHPLCERHLKRGQVIAATVVNHRTPHRGEWSLFIDPNNMESVCAPCHDRDIQSEERLGYSDEIGPDGLPVDPNHPFLR